MRDRVINTILALHAKGLNEWPCGLSDRLYPDDPILIRAKELRDKGTKDEIKTFLNQRNDEELLMMLDQQACQNYR
jgi:hypothetical protein